MNTYKIKIWEGYIDSWSDLCNVSFGQSGGYIHPSTVQAYWIRVYNG